MVKLSDYVADFIYRQGVGDVFMLSGGGSMHLVDSVGTHGRLRYLCNLHEQACAMGAEGYARARNDVAVCVVTTGPGGTNTLTGLIGAWLDSAPVVFISGQVKRETIRPFPELRQLGDQEINIVDIMRPVTKYAVCVMEPADIRYHLEKAFYLARRGRPGPVWIDIPLDVQAAPIEPDRLRAFSPDELGADLNPAPKESDVEQAVKMLERAERPVLLAGKGIRIAGAQKEFLELVGRLKIPIITSFTGFDLLPNDHPYYQGRQGTVGPRGGNFIVQNSDLLLCIGTRLNLRMVSYNYPAFAPRAKKIVVDVDAAELRKPTLKPDLPVVSDAKFFIERLSARLGAKGLKEKAKWMDYCRRINAKYPVITPAHRSAEGLVNVYAFVDELSERMKENDTMVLADGFACIVPYQAFRVKTGQQIIVNSGCASMGYDLPAAIGACLAGGKRDVVCLAGDGSIQLNIQELQTIVHYKLPVKIFVFNNNGYLSIRETQKNYFNGRYIASSPQGGVTTPDMGKIAAAYGIPFVRISDNRQLGRVGEVLSTPGAVICELMMHPDKGLDIKASSAMDKDGKMVSRPLEDLAPFLPREELRENMQVETWYDKPG